MPWSFSDIIGQEQTLERLAREFAAGRMAHAYMLEGASGIGKTALARGLAGALLCSHPDEARRACGSCRPCLMLAHGTHPDYLELPREPADLRIGRFVQRQGGTETVDHYPVLDFLRFKPVEGSVRVAVIPDAERMRPEAANAFLKTLEEPPGDALIILTVNARDRLPATVASRCRRVGVQPLSARQLADELEKRGIAAGQDAMDLALTAEGSLGTALALAQGDTLEFWRWLESEALATPSAGAAKRLADGWLTRSPAAGENAGKRQAATAALDLTALAIRRKLRQGMDANKGAAALLALWTAADQVARNVRPDLALLSCAFEVMAALRY